MSRAMNLTITEQAALDHCQSKGIGVSTIEALPDGGIRLVCMSMDGAELMRRKFKSQLIKGAVRRTMDTPMRPSW